MTLSPDLTPVQIASALKQLGAELVTYRPGQVVQYENHLPRGYFLPVQGCLRIISATHPDRLECFDANARPRLFPELGKLEVPMPCRLVAEGDVSLWFFSRFLCEPTSFLALCLEGLDAPGNPLFNLWSRHVSTT